MSAFAGGDVVLGAPCAAGAGSAAVAELLWFTYRCGFEELAPYGFTDDAGWGCMLRSAQMLLGNALTRNGAAPRLATAALFADAPGDSAPFGLHNFAKCGLRYDVLPGEWYGPGVACHVLRDLVDWRRNAPGGPALRVAVRTPEAPLSVAVWKSNLQPDFNLNIFERFDASSSALLRELDESNRFVPKSAKSTSI